MKVMGILLSVYKHTHTRTHILTHMHAHTHTHTDTHMHTHTHTLLMYECNAINLLINLLHPVHHELY